MVGRLMFTMDVSSVAMKMPIARIASTAHLLACSCPSSVLEIASLLLDESASLCSCMLEVSLERLCFTSSVSFCCISVLFWGAALLHITNVWFLDGIGYNSEYTRSYFTKK